MDLLWLKSRSPDLDERIKGELKLLFEEGMNLQPEKRPTILQVKRKLQQIKHDNQNLLQIYD